MSNVDVQNLKRTFSLSIPLAEARIIIEEAQRQNVPITTIFRQCIQRCLMDHQPSVEEV